MRADPPVRKDGRCAQCGKVRKLPKPQKGVDRALYEIDPFCSSPCARAYHGVALVKVIGGDPDEQRGRYKRAAA